MFSLLPLTLCISSASAWGIEGHAAVAQLATNLLSERVVKLAEESIGGGEKMTDISSWADDVKRTPEFAWSYDLHFVNVPARETVYDYARDCGRADFLCVVSAVRNYTQRASIEGNFGQLQKSEATKFLVHFMGDIHQPLHTGWVEDRGGNDVVVQGTFVDPPREMKLHKIWDTYMIEERERELESSMRLRAAVSHKQFRAGWHKMVNEIMDLIEGEFSHLIPEWNAPCAAGIAYCSDVFAQQSIKVAVEKAYSHLNGTYIETGDTLGRDYFVDRMNIVYFQLAKAGVRLAYVLENIVFAEEEAEMTCPAADLKCQIDSNDMGSYCKYYQKGPGGSVCQGSDLPCHCNPEL